MSVPREELVATRLPDGGTVSVVSALSCAMNIDTGCLTGRVGGLGGAEIGGPRGSDGAHGGRWMRWTCPIWRPGIASRVEYAAVAIASKPERLDV